nr:Beta-hexosaminidase [Raoultella sp. NCTC 9187]
MPLDAIKRQIDGMAAAKLNVFHWHLTDDQGWRFASTRYPKLQQQASDGLFYTQAQMKEIVRYATDRGIRVVPEIDMPGHASAIAVAYPELMSAPGPYQMERHWGVLKPVLDPSKEATYAFAEAMIGELAAIFPDPYLHIGGMRLTTASGRRIRRSRSLCAARGWRTAMRCRRTSTADWRRSSKSTIARWWAGTKSITPICRKAF